jgi:glycerophosphoryl diester phosphodiesterase
MGTQAPAAAAPAKKSRPPAGSMYHVPRGTPYHTENGSLGIYLAARLGYHQIDLDLQMTKDKVIVATHWSQPMKKDGYYDPLGKLKADRKVSSMTWAEVSRLRTRSGYRIYPLELLIPLLGVYDMVGSLEIKGDRRFNDVRVMRQIKSWCRQAGVTAYIKQIPKLSKKHAQTMKAARTAGFWTRKAGVKVKHQDWRPPARSAR